MLPVKSNEIRLPVYLCLIAVLLTSTPTKADSAILLAEAETGSMAARQAAEQKAALAKKAAEREARKAAEAQKNAETSTSTAPNANPAEQQKEHR